MTKSSATKQNFSAVQTVKTLLLYLKNKNKHTN